MTSLFRAWRRNSNANKHQKLSEDWSINKEPVIDGVTFFVKYLGSVLVDDNKEEGTSEAIKTVIAMAKGSSRKLQRVGLTVSLEGIRIFDMVTEETILENAIHRISNCFVEAHFSRVFSFIATNSNETMECHCFLCPKRKMASEATLTIAQSFNVAYEVWQISEKDDSSESSTSLGKGSVDKDPLSPVPTNGKAPDSPMLINFSDTTETVKRKMKSWVDCENDDELVDLNNSFARINSSAKNETHSNSNSHFVFDLADFTSTNHNHHNSDGQMYSERKPILDLLCV